MRTFTSVTSALRRGRRKTRCDCSRADTPRPPRGERAFAFAQRRKMLRRGLADWAGLIDWDGLGIPATARAEELSVPQFIALADSLLDAGVLKA